MEGILHEYMDSASRHAHAVGFSVVKENDQIRGEENLIFNQFFGPACVGGRRPFSENSFIWAASTTKLVTATAAMIAVDMGLFQLDDDVTMYLPQLSRLEVLHGFDNNGVPVLRQVQSTMTIHHLLSHTSGFAYLSFHPELRRWGVFNGTAIDDFCGNIDRFHHPLLFEPGQGWGYGPGFDWVGRVIEVVSGMTLESFFQEYIWKKIGVTDSTFFPELRPDFASRVTEICTVDAEGRVKGRQRAYPTHPKDCLGGEGLWSTPHDLRRFLTALFLKPGALLSPSSVEALITPCESDPSRATAGLRSFTNGTLVKIFPKRPLATGLGPCVTLQDLPGRRSVGSASWVAQSNIHWWFDPKERLVALFCMQLIPPGLPQVTDLLVDLEVALYRQLRGGGASTSFIQGTL